MIIECKKIAEGYKPVKGNEKEIINHLFDHYGECYVEKNKETVSFHIAHKTYFINDETTFFKCGKNGEIHTAEDKYNFKNYFAVPFHKNADLMRVFIAPNFESCTRDEVNRLVWGLKTTTETFAVSYNDILIFDMCWRIVDCLRNDQTQLYRDVLESNGYIIERD